MHMGGVSLAKLSRELCYRKVAELGGGFFCGKRKGMRRGNDVEKEEKYGIIRLGMLWVFIVGGDGGGLEV